MNFYCAAVIYLYDIPVRKQPVAGIVPRPAYVAADSTSSSDEGLSLWPLKLILGIAAVAIGVPAIIAVAQLGLYLIAMCIVGIDLAAAMRDMT